MDGLVVYVYAPLLPISVLFATRHWAAEVVQLYNSLKHWSVWNVHISNIEVFLISTIIIIILKASFLFESMLSSS